MVNWNVLNKRSVRMMIDNYNKDTRCSNSNSRSNSNQIGSNFEGSRRFTVSTTSDPLRAKTSYEEQSAHFVGSRHKMSSYQVWIGRGTCGVC